MATTEPHACWCGNGALVPWSSAYARCDACHTLVLAARPAADGATASERVGIYELGYFTAQAVQRGDPTLADRARLDLPERAAFWLRTLISFRSPPARVLELGSASGAFVGLLAAAGYDATGLDLSPDVTALARAAFEVPVLTGPVEAQGLPAGSFDVIAMMDVLEHLPDPLGTLRRCRELLAEDGLLLVQTPRCDPACSVEELRRRGDPFFAQFLSGPGGQGRTIPGEHLYLFGVDSVRALLDRAGLGAIHFVPAIFAHYDMAFVASRRPIAQLPEETWRTSLRRTRSGRIVEALLDARELGDARARAAEAKLQEIERDRAERLDVIQQQHAHLQEIERDRAERLDVIHRLQAHVEEIDRDRAERLDVIQQQQAHLQEIERDRAERLEVIHRLTSERDALRRGLEFEQQGHAELADRHAALLRRLGPLARLFRPR